MMTLNEIEKEISVLATEEKAEILHNLIIELDGSEGEGVKEAWLKEVDNRYNQLKNGHVKTIPAEQVFSKARERLENES